eukprot:1469832-Rhodomonas_salina.5
MIKKAFLPAVAFVLLTGALHCRSAQIYSENLRKEERNVGWSRRAGSMLGTSSFHGADRRMLAIEVELPIEALDEGGTGPDLALKSKSGAQLHTNPHVGTCTCTASVSVVATVLPAGFRPIQVCERDSSHTA